MKKAAIYCHVGNAEATRQICALNQQRDMLKEYAKEHEIIIVASYEDMGYSGFDLTRPGLTKLQEDCNTGKYDMVLVTDYDRFYRGNIFGMPDWPFEVLALNGDWKQ